MKRLYSGTPFFKLTAFFFNFLNTMTRIVIRRDKKFLSLKFLATCLNDYSHMFFVFFFNLNNFDALRIYLSPQMNKIWGNFFITTVFINIALLRNFWSIFHCNLTQFFSAKGSELETSKILTMILRNLPEDRQITQ